MIDNNNSVVYHDLINKFFYHQVNLSTQIWSIACMHYAPASTKKVANTTNQHYGIDTYSSRFTMFTE